MFDFLEDKYVGFKRTRELVLLGGGWITVGRRESNRDGRGKATSMEVDIITLQDTLLRVQYTYWW